MKSSDIVHILKKITRLLQIPVNSSNWHFSVSQVTNSYRSSTPFYGHCLHQHCTLSIHDYCSTISIWCRPTCFHVFFFQFKAKSRTFSNESIACWFSRTVIISNFICCSYSNNYRRNLLQLKYNRPYAWWRNTPRKAVW